MKDTVYRQDAIDALRGLAHRFEDPEDWCILEGEAEYVIQKLPSAQPEQRWIPCDETVEIPDHEVLACDKYGEEILGYLEYADDQWICESEGCVMYDPIAWMEKPEPYVERRQNG